MLEILEVIPEERANIDVLLVDVNLHVETALRGLLPNMRIDSISRDDATLDSSQPVLTVRQAKPDLMLHGSMEEMFKFALASRPEKLVWIVDGYLDSEATKTFHNLSNIDLVLTAPVSSTHLADWLRNHVHELKDGDEFGLNSLTAQIWKQRKPSVLEKVQSLQDQIALLVMDSGSLDTHISAERLAHQLSGSLGTFGKHDGSKTARFIEEILIVKPFNPDQSRKITHLLFELENSVSEAIETLEDNSLSQGTYGHTENLESIDYEFSQLARFAVIHEATISVNTFSIQEPDSKILRMFKRRLAQLVSPHISSADLCYWKDDSRLVVVRYNSERRNFEDKGQEICNALRMLASEQATPGQPRIMFDIATFPSDGKSLADLVVTPTTDELELGFAPDSKPSPILSSVDIMVIDDDELLTETLKIALGGRGHTVSIISNGQQALETLGGINHQRPIRPKVILLDLDLPGMNGSDLLRKIKKMPILGDIEVIVVSGRASEKATLDVLGNGAAEFVQKPFSLPVLIQRVELKLGSAA